MPLYVYRCSHCGMDFEHFLPMPGEDSFPCPGCGKSATRQIPVVNHTFGWRLSDESNLKGHKDELVKNV